MVIFFAVLGLSSVNAQSIVDQKKVVGFAFGTAHLPDASKKFVEIYAPLGTVFFVAYPDIRLGPDRSFIYLVTAKHVLKDTDGKYLKEITVRLNFKEPKAEVGYGNIEHIPVADPNNTEHTVWLQDSNVAVDVAAFPLAPSSDIFDWRSIPISMFVDDSTLRSDLVAEGDSAYFIGLMEQYYGKNRNYPVVRRGSLALMTDEQIDTPTGRQRAFIAELVIWPGNSGSPVFLNLTGVREGKGGNITIGGSFRFLGILSGSYNNIIEGTVLDATNARWGNGLPTGISFIVPADRLKAVLDSQAAQDMRDAEIHHISAPN